MTQHWDPSGYSLSFLPKASTSPVSPQASLVHTAPPLPGIFCLWLTPLVVNLVTLHSAVKLKHHRARAESLLGLRLLFSLRLLLLRGVDCLSTMVAALWGMTQHQGFGGYSLSSLPKASILSLSSGVSSPLSPHLSQSQG